MDKQEVKNRTVIDIKEFLDMVNERELNDKKLTMYSDIVEYRLLPVINVK